MVLDRNFVTGHKEEVIYDLSKSSNCGDHDVYTSVICQLQIFFK